MIKRITLAALALSLAASLTVTLAAGTTANVSWSAPTTYTDGTALASSDIAHYTIAWSPSSGQGGPSGSVQVAAGTLTASVPVACGAVTFTATVTTSATAKYPNATSGPSGPVPYATGVSCAPNPPQGLAVQ